VDAQNRPYGSTIDLISEAARRSGIELEWVLVTAGPDRVLTDGTVDLWPLVNDLPERRHLYITEPFAQATYWLMSEVENPVMEPGDTEGQSVAVIEGLPRKIAHDRLPHTEVRVYKSVEATITALCGGEVFSAIVVESPTHAAVFRKPVGCQLRMTPLENAKLWSGIGASPRRPGAREAADRLRWEIGSMVDDGTFSTISLKWFGYPTNEAAMVGSLSLARREARRLNVWLLIVSAAAMALLWMAIRLRAARRAAEQATIAKSAFLANMSHEIRTPMNGVIGMTGLLLEMNLTPEQIDCAEVVRRSGESLLRVINDILDFSKLEAGKMSLENRPLDMHDLLEDVYELLAPRVDGSRVRLLLDYPGDLPRRFLGDAERLRQIATNLLSNAVKFTTDGHIVTTVAAERSAGDARLRITVRDTGIGIAAGDLGKLFQKFSQVDGSSTRKYSGTGLGLAICKQLVEAMHGEIGVESRPGAGSSFWFSVSLPLDPHPPAEASSMACLGGLRALVLDRDELGREILERQIQESGMRCDAIADYKAAALAVNNAIAAGDPYRFVLLTESPPSPLDCKGAEVVSLLPGWQRSTAGDVCLTRPVRQSHLWKALAARLGRGALRQIGGVPCTPAQPAEQSLKHLRVLLAEDNPVNQRVGKSILMKAGVNADIAENGRLAVEMCAVAPYDLIFMDCQMPEMDGYEAARQIRLQETGGHRTAIIAMTADVLSGARERCLEAGMDDYVAKPIKPADLSAILQKWAAESKPAEINATSVSH
jgi:signal transduction histidine kinase/CheY-like chemotaxis protein